MPSNDIAVNLFKGYKAITDSQFKMYVAQKINEDDKGGSFSEDLLMALPRTNTRCFSDQVSGNRHMKNRRKS